MMKQASSSLFLSLLSLFLILPFIHGHMYLSSLKIDGTAFDEGDCVRMTRSNSPISSVTSQDMTCGFRPAADTAANRRCPVKAGSKIGLQWYHERPAASDQIVDPSHKGPCTIYLAKDDGTNNPNWFKIYEIGYDFTANEFCVAKLIRNRGLMETTIPADIEPGNYLIRGETIALHEGYRVGGAQPYVGCGEIQITGSGKAKPPTVKLPGAYQPTDPGLYISIYNPFTSYIVPGPVVYTSGSSSSGGSGNGGSGNGINNGDGIKSGGASKSGGMSAGGTAALVIFFIALAGVIVGGAFYYHKKGHIMGKTLPPSIANILPSSFGRSSTSNNNNNNSGGDRRDNGNYTAYVEQENL